jgi:hypothetical protein
VAAINCKLLLNMFTDLELIRVNGFKIIKPQVIKTMLEVNRKNQFGIVVNNAYREIDYHYFLVDYLTIMRSEIDRFIENNSCITQEQLNCIYKKYDIDCILSKFICLEFNKAKEINELFKIKKGNDVVIYYWGLEGQCEQQPLVETYYWGLEGVCIQNVPPYPFRLLEDGNYRLLEDNNKRYLEG